MALFPFLLTLARSFFVPRVELMAEILALRQQLAILNRTANISRRRCAIREHLAQTHGAVRFGLSADCAGSLAGGFREDLHP